jgi:hypothetical protein
LLPAGAVHGLQGVGGVCGIDAGVEQVLAECLEIGQRRAARVDRGDGMVLTFTIPRCARRSDPLLATAL